MIDFDKSEIKASLTTDQIFDLLNEWGGEPEYIHDTIVSSTICHNLPGEGSRKLYYYINNKLFKCYTGCGNNAFDIYELICKIAEIQWGEAYDLNDAVRWLAARFSIQGTFYQNDNNNFEYTVKDREIFQDYLHRRNSNQNINLNSTYSIQDLKKYDNSILQRFNYTVINTPWQQEGIAQEVLTKAKIGYYPKDCQITIPHYDINNNLIGIRGRTLIQEEAENYGKYRPLKINRQLFNHPLGQNLYGINWAKNTIQMLHKVIIFESEKSVLKYASYFGWDNNISVACCGFSISEAQILLLKTLQVQEIIIAFDRQYHYLGDTEFQKWLATVQSIGKKYKNYIKISTIYDKKLLTGYKDSPIDCGPDIFIQLYNERVYL